MSELFNKIANCHTEEDVLMELKNNPNELLYILQHLPNVQIVISGHVKILPSYVQRGRP